MNAASLLKLLPGEHVIYLPSGKSATVVTAATPTREHGWRVQVRSTSGTSWITPANVDNWGRATRGSNS